MRRPKFSNRGAPAGNQNARTHGFYSRILTEAERELMQDALASDPLNIDQEIALVRAKLLAALRADPNNWSLLKEGTETIARLARTRYRIGSKAGDDLAEAITATLAHFAEVMNIPLED